MSTVSELQGWQVSVLKQQRAKTDRHSGLPLMTNGGPEMETIYVLVFVEKGTNNVIRYPFGDQTKNAIVQQLTGVVPASEMPAI